MNLDFLFVLGSSIALPALSIFALLLRRNLFTGKTKIILLTLGTLLLLYTVVDTFKEHGDELGLVEIGIGGITALCTFFILAFFKHKHTHAKEEDGAKGIVVSEAFHSLIDGAVIGGAYLVNPVLGYTATLGILVHEFPKIVGTLAIFRALGLSIKKTLVYGVLAQIGSPASAILVYMLGKKVSHEDFQLFEIASVSSLAAIVVWIIFLEINHHTAHKHTHEKSGH
jgi:zinc and cadmium transporter